MSDTFQLDRRALTPESYKALVKLVDDDKVLVPVKRTDRICFVHGATEYDEDECWSYNYFGTLKDKCVFDDVVRLGEPA